MNIINNHQKFKHNNMSKTTRTIVLAIIALVGMQAVAQGLTLRGVYQTSRDDDYPNGYYSEYAGWSNTYMKPIFIVQQGLYKMEWDGSTLAMPEKFPEINKSEFSSNGMITDEEKALWVTNFNLMYANSGAVIKDGILTTVMSRTDMDSTSGAHVVPGAQVNDTTRFAVRKWNAATGDLLSSEIRPAWDCLESAGMAVNPIDGKVYGLFHITNKYLPDSILNDPDFFADESADSTDSGYAICTIDLDKMEITQITPGLYYDNYITFAINSEGRAFALTSGATAAVPAEDGKYYDINGELTGSHLFEFDLKTGLRIDDSRHSTGYMSQVKRQAACFSKNDPNKMYWMGYFNSGLGFDDYGNWTPLPDKYWKTNGKYDTSLYEVDITTGEANRIDNIQDRYMFAYMWVDGEEEPAAPAGLRGDVDQDGQVNIGDVTALINYLLSHDSTSISVNNADCDQSNDVNINDVTALINYLLSRQW